MQTFEQPKSDFNPPKVNEKEIRKVKENSDVKGLEGLF